MLPSEVPIFPLPNVVLFPSALLPLHIFEPRYRAMVVDALEGERLIGMVMLQPGWEADYDRAPRVYRVGCAGFIAASAAGVSSAVENKGRTNTAPRQSINRHARMMLNGELSVATAAVSSSSSWQVII